MTKPAGRSLVLVCNSHIDPVWLWRWEEGLAETLSTFRAAAAFCEEFDGFAFCHNEALLYRWVEEYEPALFEQIRALIRLRRWHVMGGWYMQPDCNLPAGESFVRQVLLGKRYFLDRFGVEPRVAVNLDPFGHARGLVQILKKSGYIGYLFCRPDRQHLNLPGDDFVWEGHDGSTIVGHRASDHYNSERGRARAKADGWLQANGHREHGLLLWGVGNHGGGPSREDLGALGALMSEHQDRTIRHGRPEDYFEAIAADAATLPRVRESLNPWAIGCYTSMALVKRAHRQLESALLVTEKMSSHAAILGLLRYPREALAESLEDLLFCQFHDILPGEGVAEVEEQALRRLGHGLEIVSRLRTRAFFALLDGQPPARDGEYPIFVHNPHPFDVDATVICELQPPEPNADRRLFLQPALTGPGGAAVPLQLEKESCNIQIDQRKRLVFAARLAASTTTRFSCRLAPVPRPPAADAQPVTGRTRWRTDRAQFEIDGDTGLMTRYAVDGVDCLLPQAFSPLVLEDDADPWHLRTRGFREVVGSFRLMSPERAALFAGVSASSLSPVRIIETGPVRAVVEALFEFGHSAVVAHYALPASGTEFELDLRVYWFEQDRLLKLAVPTPFAGGRATGQTAYGADLFTPSDDERVAQKWIALESPDRRTALTAINDSTYGFDVRGGLLRLSILRSPAYAGHPVGPDVPIVRQDRFEPREDQGERRFRFWINGGPAAARLAAVDREATVKNEGVMALPVSPPGGGGPIVPGVTLSDMSVQLGALKMSEDGGRLVVRLFEPTGTPRTTTVTIPPLGVSKTVRLGGFEIKTLAIDLATRQVHETDLLERTVTSP